MPYALMVLGALATAQCVAERQHCATLIQRLGDHSFAVREAASRQLVALGAPAVNQMEEAAVRSHDPEIRKRCTAAVEQIFRAYMGDPTRLPEFTRADLAEFVRYAPRYEPGAVAEAGHPLGPLVHTKAESIWAAGWLTQIMTREYLKDKIRAGASKAQIKAIIDRMRHRLELHPPLTRYPEYTKLRKELGREPWYFLREYP